MDEEKLNEIVSFHKSEYNEDPQAVAFAPGRCHLIGDHSAFFKDKTLSVAIDIPVFVAISKRNDFSMRFYFVQSGERRKANYTSLKVKKEDRWANALKAIAFAFSISGYELGGMNVTISSKVQPSAGFGITTAIKIASALCIRHLLGKRMPDSEILHIIEKANKIFLEIPNTVADNLVALYAKKNTLFITNYAHLDYDYIEYPFSDKLMILCDASVPRISVWDEATLHESNNALLLGELHEVKKNVYGGWQYETNTTEINEVLSTVNEHTRRKLLCIMREHEDVLLAREALLAKDFYAFARAVNHSHESMKELFNLSCPEIDWLVKRVSELEPNLEILRNPETCARITGKGFGRCLYAFIRKEDKKLFDEKLSEYERIFGFHPSAYEVHPSSGGRLLKG